MKDFFKCGNAFKTWIYYNRNRGIPASHVLVDLVGVYLFEVLTPECILNFFLKNHGFVLNQLKTYAAWIGCNEFVFHKIMK